MEKDFRWYDRINGEIYSLVLINIALIISDYRLLSDYWFFTEFIFIILIIWILYRKSSRLIYKIEFDDKGEKMDIHYLQFLIKNYVVSIPYSQLDYKYTKKSYGIGNVMPVLVFLNSKKYIAEIREKNDISWKKEEINALIEKMDTIKENEHGRV